MKILIVENNEVVVDVLIFMLKDNFDIKVVCDNLAAFSELQNDKFDIFLFGSRMALNPENDVEFIKHIYIEKFNPYMKIIVMSDDKSKRIWPVFLGTGADIVVEKIPLRNVVEAVKSIAATIGISS